MVGVIAAMGRQVERHRQALLPAARFRGRTHSIPGRGKSRVLPDRPGLGGVHRRVRAAQERHGHAATRTLSSSSARALATSSPRTASPRVTGCSGSARTATGCWKRLPPPACSALAYARSTGGSAAKSCNSSTPTSPRSGVRQGADTPLDAKAFAGQLPPDQLTYFYDGAGQGSYENLLTRATPTRERAASGGATPFLSSTGWRGTGTRTGPCCPPTTCCCTAWSRPDLQGIDRDTVLLASGPLFHIGMWQTLIPVWMYGGTVVMSADV